jgi:ectoine hydroxylase-related dioxygenase (phytanoyl-CoA dioxygenase family)
MGVLDFPQLLDRNEVGRLRNCMKGSDNLSLARVEARIIPPAHIEELASEFLQEPVVCRLEHSWFRKRYAPPNAPRGHFPNSWHQDGGLGVSFTPAPGPQPPMTRLVTCWIALDPCGVDAPGLELIRRPLDHLLHFSELNDATLRSRFPPEDFRAPELEPGDALLFHPGVLHRTHVKPEMRRDRLSIEFRLFPRD